MLPPPTRVRPYTLPMAKSNFPKTFVITTLVLGVAGAGLWYTLGQRAEKAPEITSIQVTKGDITQVVTASGDLQPVTSIDVSSQVSGLIKEVLVDYNSPVKLGDVLAKLDTATYDQKLKQADADLASTKANTVLVRLNAARTRELFGKGLATEMERDTAQAQLEQAEAQLLTRIASVEDARVNQSRCTIYAPIDGIVMQRATEVGKTVAASLNAPTLFVIANELAKMQIVAAVAEADVGTIAEGQPVTFKVDAYPLRDFKGRVSQIRNYPKTSSNVVTYETIIDVNNEDLKLKPGMTANVSIIVAQRKGALRIMNSALRARVPEEFVMTKKGEEKPGKPETATKEIAPEERRKIMQQIFAEVGYSREAGRPTAEQLTKIQELAKARGIEWDPSRMGGGRRAGGSGGTASAEPVATRTVYKLLASDALKPQIEAVTVKVGITDSMSTEVIEGLSEGDTLITTLVVAGGSPASSGAASNPFAPRGGAGGGGGGGRR